MANNYEQIMALVNAGNQMGLSNTIKRDYGIPLDFTSIFETKAAADEYAATSTKAYEGQILAAEGVAYIIVNSALKAIGTAPQGDGKSITVSEEGMITIMGLADAAVGNLPRKAADGSIEWVPVSSVVEGDTNTITLLTESEGKTGVSAVYSEEATTYTYTINADVTMETANSVITVRQNGVEVGTITLPTAEIEALSAKIGEIAEGETVAGLIKKNADAIALLTENLTTEEIDSIKELVDYVNEHGTEVQGLKDDIAANTKAISDEADRAAGVEEGLAGRLDTLENTTVPQTLVDAKAYTDAQIAAIPEVVHPEYTVAKVAGATSDTYKLQKDSVDVAESIIVPHAYDDSTVVARIAADEKALADYKAEMVTALNGKANTSVTDQLRTEVNANKSSIEGLTSALNGDNGLSSRLGTVETTVTEHTGRLNGIDTSLAALSTKDGEIEGKITALTNKDSEIDGKITTINETLANKADKSALDSYYTKTAMDGKIGTLGEGENLVALIADAKKAGTDAATAVEALKTTEVKANADAIALLNGDDTGKSVRAIAGEAANDAVASMLADSPEAFDTLKEIADWLGTHSEDAVEMDNRIAANEAKLAGISNNETVLSVIDTKIAAAEYELPTATTETLGGVKLSEQVGVDDNGGLKVNTVSTDILVQGVEELIINGGTATV